MARTQRAGTRRSWCERRAAKQRCTAHPKRCGAVQAAVLLGEETVVSALLGLGADPAVFTRKGCSPRQLAVKGGVMHPDTVVTLIEEALRVRHAPACSAAAPRRRPTQKPTDKGVAALRGEPNLHVQRGPQRSEGKGAAPPAVPRDGDVKGFLDALGLSKYVPLFEAAGVTFAKLREMNEADLRELGLTLFGPRRKISAALRQLSEGSAH